MNRRLQILKHWLLGKRNGVSLPEIARFFFGKTCELKAKPLIKSIEATGDHIVIYFNDSDYPLYYPKEFDITSLYQVVTESFYPENWHYYEFEGTKVEPRDTVVDCGAAEGLFSLLIAKRCKKVYAIEPLPKFVESMKATFANFSNVDILAVALSDKEGEATIAGADISSGLGNSNSGIPVKVTTLDDLLFEKAIPITYIKADLEGYDYKMIKGASNIIARDNPKIAITTYHRGDHAELISRHLRDINPRYKIRVKGLEERVGAPVMLHAWVT